MGYQTEQQRPQAHTSDPLERPQPIGARWADAESDANVRSGGFAGTAKAPDLPKFSRTIL